eukprot:275184-Rhodomonas_salina.3
MSVSGTRIEQQRSRPDVAMAFSLSPSFRTMSSTAPRNWSTSLSSCAILCCESFRAVLSAYSSCIGSISLRVQPSRYAYREALERGLKWTTS